MSPSAAGVVSGGSGSAARLKAITQFSSLVLKLEQRRRNPDLALHTALAFGFTFKGTVHSNIKSVFSVIT